MVTTRPAQRIDPCDRIWGVLIKVDSTHQVNGVGCCKAAYIGIMKPERIEIQTCFPIQVLIEINYHVHVHVHVHVIFFIVLPRTYKSRLLCSKILSCSDALGREKLKALLSHLILQPHQETQEDQLRLFCIVPP